VGRGEEGGDDDNWPASPASLRLIFFVPPVFVLFIGDALILQVTGVFSRIRSGATWEGAPWQWANVDLIYLAAATAAQEQQEQQG
jgi:hypothetical protein